MGQSFERILVQEKGPASVMSLLSGIQKAAQAIGYQPAAEGEGVSVRLFRDADSEWYTVESPLLEIAAETAEPFVSALAKETRLPLLWLACVDSDFVACRLLDAAKETDTTACLGTPYEPLDAPDYDAWMAACKKKWKCNLAQLQAVFEGQYSFAEDGLTPLAGLLHIAPAIVSEQDRESEASTFWFVSARAGKEPAQPRTLAEKLADYMERERAAKFEAAGYRRYKNSPVRWHKVVGEPGNEVLLSMVFTTYRGFELAPFYGAQSLYCPLVLSDKYYPLHDASEYWREAQLEFYWKFGRNPLWIPGNPETKEWDTVLNFDTPEQLPPFLDELMLPELAEVTDLSSCRAYTLTPRKREHVLHVNSPKTRVWIEAALDGDDAETRRWYEHEKAKNARILSLGRKAEPWDQALLDAYEADGRDGLITYLRETVYRDNLKKLKRAGII